MSVNIQIGARVRRRDDIGLDEPGAVVRVNDAAAMVFWPDDNFYQVVPVAELEHDGSFRESYAA